MRNAKSHAVGSAAAGIHEPEVRHTGTEWQLETVGNDTGLHRIQTQKRFQIIPKFRTVLRRRSLRILQVSLADLNQARPRVHLSRRATPNQSVRALFAKMTLVHFKEQ